MSSEYDIFLLKQKRLLLLYWFFQHFQWFQLPESEAAADKTPVDCLSPVTTPEYPSNEGPTYGGGGAFDDENGISRIGRDDYDDDDVYNDDEEEYKPSKNPTKSRHEYDSTEPKSGGLISRIQDRLSKLFSDDEKDRYDNDDE